MFRALMNTRPSHLLDPSIFDFKGLTIGPRKEAEKSGIPDLG
jgi:tRNA 2-thiocytidine biosynthesis protein TtcA